MFSYTLSPNSLTVVTSGNKVLTTRSDNPNWSNILTALKGENESELVNLMSVRRTLENFGSELAPGAISIKNGQVYFRNEQLFGLDVDRILEFSSKGLPVSGMVSFLEKKLANPSRRSIESLYWFLENGNMPITPRGTFLAYKGVSNEFVSINTGHEPLISGTRLPNGSILNTVGQTVHMERRYVTDDFNQGCGPGLHAGSINYAKGWGPHVVIVEIDPADVVSVPSSEHEKLRCNKYTVIAEFIVPLNDTYTEEYHPELATPKEVKITPEIQALIDEAYQEGLNDRSINNPSDDQIEEDLDTLDDELDDSSLSVESVDYDTGYVAGLKDGRGHKTREYYEDERQTGFIEGYLDGYRDARK